MKVRPIIVVLLTVVILLFGIILINPCETTEPPIIDDVEKVETEEPSDVETVEPPTNDVVETPTIEKITWRVTAYCACSKCCGKWANNRPTDENGDPIVIGAGGVPLIANVSCATAYLPFGTQVQLDGYGTVTVHDRGADWLVDKFGEYYIDIYMSDHNEATAFGRQYLEGVIL